MNITPDIKKTYLKVIENSVGSRIFQNFYVTVNNRKKDILQGGTFSCAFFVSSVLKIFSLINSTHCTVDGAIKDLIKSGWQEKKDYSQLSKGSILFWEKKAGHFHLGFYTGQQLAVSNSFKNKIPIIHHWTFNNSRKIIKAWSHKFLEK